MTTEIAIITHNNANVIEEVVRSYKRAFPDAEIEIYDNRSKDRTVRIVRDMNVRIHGVKDVGKGYVINSIFRNARSDCLIVVSGNGAYNPSSATIMEKKIENRADLVIGRRSALRIKNWFTCYWINLFFTRNVRSDVFSGIKAYSARFVRQYRGKEKGRLTDLEQLLWAFQNNMNVVDVPVRYVKKLGKDERTSLRENYESYRYMKQRSVRWHTYGGLFFNLFSLIICTLLLAVPIYFLTESNENVHNVAMFTLLITFILISLFLFFLPFLLKIGNAFLRTVKWVFRALRRLRFPKISFRKKRP